jgi:hypothetical protein
MQYRRRLSSLHASADRDIEMGGHADHADAKVRHLYPLSPHSFLSAKPFRAGLTGQAMELFVTGCSRSVS